MPWRCGLDSSSSRLRRSFSLLPDWQVCFRRRITRLPAVSRQVWRDAVCRLYFQAAFACCATYCCNQYCQTCAGVPKSRQQRDIVTNTRGHLRRPSANKVCTAPPRDHVVAASAGAAAGFASNFWHLDPCRSARVSARRLFLWARRVFKTAFCRFLGFFPLCFLLWRVYFRRATGAVSGFDSAGFARQVWLCCLLLLAFQFCRFRQQYATERSICNVRQLRLGLCRVFCRPLRPDRRLGLRFTCAPTLRRSECWQRPRLRVSTFTPSTVLTSVLCGGWWCCCCCRRFSWSGVQKLSVVQLSGNRRRLLCWRLLFNCFNRSSMGRFSSANCSTGCAITVPLYLSSVNQCSRGQDDGFCGFFCLQSYDFQSVRPQQASRCRRGW